MHAGFRPFVQRNEYYCQDLHDSVCHMRDKDTFVCHLERYHSEPSDRSHNADRFEREHPWCQSFLVKRHMEGYHIIRSCATTQHDYTTAWQVLDVDMSGLPCGPK